MCSSFLLLLPPPPSANLPFLHVKLLHMGLPPRVASPLSDRRSRTVVRLEEEPVVVEEEKVDNEDTSSISSVS